jgi:RNA polymerase sigma-B factor
VTSARRPGAAGRGTTSDATVRPAGRTVARSEPAHEVVRVTQPVGPGEERAGALAPSPTEERPAGHRPTPRRVAAAEQDEEPTGDRDRRASYDLFRRLQACAPGTPEWRTHRDELVRRHLPLAHYLVRRFAGRGEPMDDLVQVATIGLIKAVDRFDLERGVEFSTYATPTVVGEVKRYFRDRGWAIRVPRRMQEHTLAVSRATGDLFGRLSRSPTIAELAGYTQLTEEEVLEAIGSAHAYTTVSLDVELADDSPGGASHPAAGDAQAALENVEHRASLRPLLSRLTSRERQILALRFFANMTQSEIAAEIGVSQMHVSRLLSRTLAHLREGLEHPE